MKPAAFPPALSGLSAKLATESQATKCGCIGKGADNIAENERGAAGNESKTLSRIPRGGAFPDARSRGAIEAQAAGPGRGWRRHSSCGCAGRQATRPFAKAATAKVDGGLGGSAHARRHVSPERGRTDRICRTGSACSSHVRCGRPSPGLVTADHNRRQAAEAAPPPGPPLLLALPPLLRRILAAILQSQWGAIHGLGASTLARPLALLGKLRAVVGSQTWGGKVSGSWEPTCWQWGASACSSCCPSFESALTHNPV